MRALTLAFALLAGAPATAAPVVHHDVVIRLSPTDGTLDVTDRVTLPAELASTPDLVVQLHEGLSPRAEGASLAPAATGAAPSTGLDAVEAEGLRLEAFRVQPAGRSFTLRYRGRIVHPPRPMPEEHQRAFSVTPGTIQPEGVYLSMQGGFLGRFGDELVTYTMTVEGLPAGWQAVSEGDRKGANRHESKAPLDELHLVAGPWTEHTRKVGDVEVVALLRSDAPALAERYLSTTKQYLEMYEALIGEYPYSRFALVENFWETGYGMASFTLLGPKIIRFPFILHSSYPHELLHNWWGNSVFLDPEGGNWAEGLTAYLADHLVEEQRGRGALYRQRALSRYADYVREGKDFPLAAFRGRTSAASEAVGYGKWLMVVHMLRQELGDEVFKRALRRFYEENRFSRVGFDAFRRALERESGRDLAGFFTAWVERAGAPRIRWSHVSSSRDRAGRWSATVVLEQVQPEPPFPMSVPVAVTLEDGRVEIGRAAFDGRTAKLALAVPAKPARVDVDPRFDVFRRLERGEVAPSLSLALGAERATFVLPTFASDDERRAWRRFAEVLCGPAKGRCRILDDKEVRTLPDQGSVWVLGYGNALRAAAFVGSKTYGARLDDGAFRLDGTVQENASHSLALAFESPRNPDEGLVFVAADRTSAIAGLARKLPHYGKYGYLGFQGDEPANVLKGAWDAVRSPMTVALAPGRLPALRLPKEEPLASLPPPFDAERMLEDVRALADPKREGRGYGSAGLDQAASYVEKAMKRAGLAPFEGSFQQCFEDPAGPKGKPVRACNVVGVLPGKDPKAAAVVLGAHLDHLGRGWPEARKGNSGKVHPGANDNASGVAVLLEAARSLARAGGLRRPVVFVAFTGEEAGLRGSRHFVRALGDDATARVHSMVNLDTVGRAEGRPFLVLGGESAKEWVHIFMGIGFVTGVESRLAAVGLEASDHVAFLEKGVPAAHLFSGPTSDYHQPADTPAVVEPDSLVKAATLAREAVAYLADRDAPLTSTSAPRGHTEAPRGERKVSLGTVPDFAWRGPGVRLQGVVPGSPAARAGLVAGDVIVRFGGEAVTDLRGFASQLRKAEAGQNIELGLRRGDEEMTVEVVLDAR